MGSGCYRRTKTSTFRVTTNQDSGSVSIEVNSWTSILTLLEEVLKVLKENVDEITVDRVFLSRGVTDMRKSIDGLAVLVQRRI